MSDHYRKIIATPDDYSKVLDAINHFEEEYAEARTEVPLTGRIDRCSAELPGIVEYRYAQYMEIESILEHLNIQFKKIKGTKYRYYLEKYNRDLSSRDAEKYAEADEDLLALSEVINHVALIRNKYQGLHQALQVKGFQINNITKLRTAGMEDAEVTNLYVPK